MALSLAALDEPPDDPLLPETWLRNLAALRSADHDFAQRLESAPFAGLRPVRALDGFATYRSTTDSPGWFAGSGIPLERARALVDAYVPGELNASLPSLDAGAELTLLLQKLPPHAGVFVFEQNEAVIAAVLRRMDVSQDVARRRCVFVPAAASRDALLRLLETHPGLLPPGNILRTWGADESRLSEVRNLCQATANEVSGSRSRRMQFMLDHPAQPSDPLRIAVVSWVRSSAASDVAEQVADAMVAAAAVPDAAVALCARGPADVHPLACFERLAQFAPALCIAVAGGPARFPLSAPIAEWHVSTDLRQVPDAARLHLAASPHIEAALKRAHPAVPIAPFYWAAPVTVPAASEPSGPIVLVSDGDAARSAQDAPDLPTQRLVWDRMGALVESQTGLDSRQTGKRLLDRAERDVGLRLPDAARAALVRRADDTLIPAQELRTILAEVRADAAVVAVGMGWSVGARAETDRWVPDWRALVVSRLSPRAAIFIGGDDPLSAGLVEAAAAGWPVALHLRAPSRAAELLGGVLSPAQHITVFSSKSELQLWLTRLRDRPADLGEMARAAVRHLAGRHTWATRVAALRAAVVPANLAQQPGPRG